MFSYSISLTISYKKIVVIKLIQSKKHSPLVPDFDTTLVLVVHSRGRRGRDRMVDGFTTTYAISTYPH